MHTRPAVAHPAPPPWQAEAVSPDQVGSESPALLVVDAANVVGSVPDGWWRDREGAATRLRDALSGLADRGLPDLEPPVEVVLVVEGAARGVPAVPGVRVVAAGGSGDDEIVALVRAEAAGRRCAVVTADRGLRARVTALGAAVYGPSTLPRWSAGRGGRQSFPTNP
jgi:hypothetical protein